MADNRILLAKNTSLSGDNRNILVVGTCASGKTYNYVYPNLLQCNGSCIVVDKGGYVQEMTEEVFRKKGYRIMTVNMEKDPTATISIEDIKTIGQTRTVLYIIPHLISSEVNASAIPYIINNVFTKTAPDCPIPIHIFADEFACYGLGLKDFYKRLANRHPRISCSICIMSFDQLRWVVGDKWPLFVGACDAILFLSSPCDANTMNIL